MAAGYAGKILLVTNNGSLWKSFGSMITQDNPTVWSRSVMSSDNGDNTINVWMYLETNDPTMLPWVDDVDDPPQIWMTTTPQSPFAMGYTTINPNP